MLKWLKSRHENERNDKNVKNFYDLLKKGARPTGRRKTGKQTTETKGAADVDVKVNEWGLFIVPGISYQLNDKFNFVAKLGSGLGYANTKRENESTNAVRKTSTFGFSASSMSLSFGMYYNF